MLFAIKGKSKVTKAQPRVKKVTTKNATPGQKRTLNNMASRKRGRNNNNGNNQPSKHVAFPISNNVVQLFNKRKAGINRERRHAAVQPNTTIKNMVLNTINKVARNRGMTVNNVKKGIVRIKTEFPLKTIQNIRKNLNTSNKNHNLLQSILKLQGQHLNLAASIAKRWKWTPSAVVTYAEKLTPKTRLDRANTLRMLHKVVVQNQSSMNSKNIHDSFNLQPFLLRNFTPSVTSVAQRVMGVQFMKLAKKTHSSERSGALGSFLETAALEFGAKHGNVHWTRANNELDALVKDPRVNQGLLVLKAKMSLDWVKTLIPDVTPEDKVFRKMVRLKTIDSTLRPSAEFKKTPYGPGLIDVVRDPDTKWKGVNSVEPDAIFLSMKDGKLHADVYELKIGTGKPEDYPAEAYQLAFAKKALQLNYPGIEVDLHFFAFKYGIPQNTRTDFRDPYEGPSPNEWCTLYRLLPKSEWGITDTTREAFQKTTKIPMSLVNTYIQMHEEKKHQELMSTGKAATVLKHATSNNSQMTNAEYNRAIAAETNPITKSILEKKQIYSRFQKLHPNFPKEYLFLLDETKGSSIEKLLKTWWHHAYRNTQKPGQYSTIGETKNRHQNNRNRAQLFNYGRQAFKIMKNTDTYKNFRPSMRNDYLRNVARPVLSRTYLNNMNNNGNSGMGNASNMRNNNR